MDWNYDDLFAFKSKVLNYKEDYMGEKIGQYVFGGAGNKCIKLNGSVPEDTVFISYEDVLDEKTKTAKEVYNYFFKDDSTTENIPVETIDRITGDFEEVIENILIEKGLMTENDFLFAVSELGAWTDKNKMINHIKKSYDFILFDTKYLYLIRKSEMDNNYEVEDIKYNSRFKELVKEML